VVELLEEIEFPDERSWEAWFGDLHPHYLYSVVLRFGVDILNFVYGAEASLCYKFI
jgi:hypothetical protein